MKNIIILCLFLGLCLQKTTSQIIIDPSQTYQTIEGFSASDCWTGNYVGTYWKDAPKNAIAKYLFSQNLKADGSPEGIGLSMWRFNLGAGTAEQGDASDIEDLSRRAECFLDETGTTYDWTKQAGQQWFLKKAKEYGCENFVAFSNAPLVFYSRNGKGYSNGDGYANLQADKYDDFADYLTTVLQHFEQEEGITFNYISPLNEPQYGWNTPAQEGSPWQNDEIKKMAVELDKSIVEKGINTKILLSEAGSWDYLYKSAGRASNQIYQFFDRRSTNYIGNLASLAPVIGGHSYWTHTTNIQLRNTRLDVKTNAKKYNLNVFQTEWSMLDAGEGFPGYEEASYMDIALFMAKVIHGDLAFANVTSWSYWTSMDTERWGHKDRFHLLALAPGGNFYNPITESGIVYDRSTLWALGNYSYFIRPGYQRIMMQGADNLAELMGTAYISPDHSRIVVVYVNMAYEVKKVNPVFQNMTGSVPVTSRVYVTNSIYNLKKIGSTASDIYDPEKELTVPSRSVATVVYDLKSTSGIHQVNARQLQVYPNPVAVSGTLNVELPDKMMNENLVLSVYSTHGSLLYSKRIEANGMYLSLSLPEYLQAGSYILKIQSGNYSYHSRFLVH